MPLFATRSVVSGRAYPVIEVAAGVPAILDDFTGNTRFVVDLDGDPYTVCGFGRHAQGGVRFYEKDSDGLGRDVRVWAVRVLVSDAGFSASHVAH